MEVIVFFFKGWRLIVFVIHTLCLFSSLLWYFHFILFLFLFFRQESCVTHIERHATAKNAVILSAAASEISSSDWVSRYPISRLVIQITPNSIFSSWLWTFPSSIELLQLQCDIYIFFACVIFFSVWVVVGLLFV